MGEYYRQELLTMVQSWPPERLQTYIQELEERVKYTQEHIRALKTLRKRITKKYPRDTGTRGG